MRTTLTIDDATLAEAERLTGCTERPKLIQVALESLIAREKAKRLADLGCSEPDAEPIRRRRS
ncbi:MAG: type II toxin-antitoxin system VapB family antitoxin [Puniceicoccales bacterium]